jgi:hypothetical protein
MMENSPGKQTSRSRVVPLAPAMWRVAPATVEPESHLTLPPTYCASYHRVRTMANMLFESVSEYESLMARIDSRTQESHREDAMVYPGLGQFGPYIQQLMILILKSTQN